MTYLNVASSAANSEVVASPLPLTMELVTRPSAHPHLRLALPSSFLQPPHTISHRCQASILVRLPPGLFLDPYTFPLVKDSSPDSQTKGKVVQDVKPLNISQQWFSALDQDLSRVELERGMGYSLDHQERQKLARQMSSGAGVTARQSEVLVAEYTAYLLSLRRLTADVDDTLAQRQRIKVDIPLHTRYPIPLTPSNAMSGSDLLSIDWPQLIDTLLMPSKGSYYTALLERPHAIWTCRGEGLVAVDTGLYEATTAEEILAPMHNHLQLPSPFQSSDQIYRLLPPFGTSGEPFRVRTPMGRAEYGVVTQCATLTCLLLAALSIIASATSAIRQVRRSERVRTQPRK